MPALTIAVVSAIVGAFSLFAVTLAGCCIYTAGAKP